ncbi:hypothetical protein QUF88_22160 [Bacillus sp. DX1.1]|uniref:hypothetical protein n=1 Tax=unclassified Bacillus (in: firmicutes) TaxID=185979 RepID=UPI0025705577|nr:MULTISPECIES: hypothetical protein [unclassified Bacillus (in: firmicutes)]MDM5156418.1 hypothetical protein [Bacillus sp. DX1.1]WJE80687.1 hypothetical protein QRE67_19695 [Bacillus sp. DX3.1]
MMRKQTLKGRIVMGVGLVLFSIGLMMLNFYSDLVLFENVNKSVGAGVFIVGILCIIASNFFRKSNNANH